MPIKYKLNPFTGQLDATSVEELSGYFKLDQTTPQTVTGNPTFPELLLTRPIAFTYNGSGQLISVAKTGGTTKTLNYNGDGTLNTINDGTRTKTFHWSGGVLQSISVA